MKSRLLVLLAALSLTYAWGANPVEKAKPAGRTVSDRTFVTSSSLSREAAALVRVLEDIHYNHGSVKPADYAKLIPDFMGELDGQRLFFLLGDKTDFLARFSSRDLYWSISSLGRVSYAFDVFRLYESRAQARIAWIFEELKKPVDLTAQETYVYDRVKAEWPASIAEADELWRRRIKFEVVGELLSRKGTVAPEVAMEEAKGQVRKRYERMLKNIAELEGMDLAEMFLGTLARMYDPHSTYFSADTYEDFNIQMRLKLVGIGAMLSLEDDYCVVKEVVPGGPADLSKRINPNDKIISVGQMGAEPVEIIGMKLRKIVEMIRGAKGTQVRLFIQPADATDSSVRKEVVLTRDIVQLDSARAYGAIFEVPDTDGTTSPIGVITLPTFYGPDGSPNDPESRSATRDVAKLVDQMQSAGIKGLVLDLRRNGGGLLSEAIDLTGLFISRGPVVQVRAYNGDLKVDEDDDARVAYSGPLAVLVSRFSASASEIVAGALQNYGRAVVIGDSSTHGKGTVQTVLEMRNIDPELSVLPAKSGATKLTVQKFYLPNGASTQLKGVIPDIVLPSIDEFLPIGEKDLPHALVWDEIPSSIFDGKPLDPRVLTPLRTASVARQQSLPEFDYLRRSIEFFRRNYEQKSASLNLEDRRRQKATDDAYRKELDAEKLRLAAADFKYREFLLAPPPPPRAKPAAPPADSPSAESGEDDPLQLGTEDDPQQKYAKLDIHLRESLRVISDALKMGRQRELWASDHAPLSASVDKKG